jgi:mannitol operon transcriptional antiterminator
MSQLDTRSRDVLNILLQTPNPIALRQIADQLEITPRMMRVSLNTIQSWLVERDANLIRKPNFGIQIQATNVQRNHFKDELRNQKDYLLYLSPIERIDILILLLLLEVEQPLLPENIEPILGISHPTLLKDVEKAHKMLEKYSLDLVYKPRFGFQVHGREADWREAMVHHFITKFGVMSLLALENDPGAQPEMKAGSNINFLNTLLTDALLSLDLISAHAFVKRLEESLNRRFADVAFVRLVCHLALAISRSSQGKVVEMPGVLPENFHGTGEAEVIGDLLRSAAFSFPEPEIEFFIRQVCGAKIQYTMIDMLQSHRSQAEQLETQEIVRHIVDEASLHLHPFLKVDQQLIRALSMHIQVVKNRLRFGLLIDNPLQKAVEAQYPHIVKVASESVAYLADQINKPVPSEEIAYIAMHLGAAMERLRPYIGQKRRVWIVCGEGTATAWLLVARLKAEFPEIEVLEVSSALEITQNPPHPNQVDLVLTTLPLEIPHVITLEVSPLLTPDDRARIQSTLNLAAQRKIESPTMAGDMAPSLASLLVEDTIALGVRSENWEGVVEAAGGLLYKVQAIQSRYIEAMKEVIYSYGPYVVFAPGVALLHARPEDGVNRICMSLITLEPHVPFHHPNHDPVSLAFGFGVVDNHSHLKALAQLANLLSDNQRLTCLKSARTKSEIVEILSQEN